MKSHARIFVAGATGTVGSAIAARLKRDGHRIFATTANAKNKKKLAQIGYTPVVLDLANSRAVTQAIADCKPDYIVNAARGKTDAVKEEPAFAKNLADAAEAVGVSGMVYVSVFQADGQTGVPHFDIKAQIEEALSHRSFPVASLRPTTFMNLLLSPMVLGNVLENGVFVSPQAPDTLIEYIHTDEIAAVASHLIAGDIFEAGIFIFGGPEALTTRDIADLYSRVLGKPIEIQQIPIEAIKQRVGADLAIMADYLNTHGFVVGQPNYPMGYTPNPIIFDETLIREALK